MLPRVTWMAIEGRSYAMTAAVAVWLTVLFVSLLRRPDLGQARRVRRAGRLRLVAQHLLWCCCWAPTGVTLLLERRLRFRRVFWTWLGAALVGLAGGLPVLLTAVSQSGQIGDTQVSGLGYLRQTAGQPVVRRRHPHDLPVGGIAEVVDGPG